MIPEITGALIGAGTDLLGGLMSNMFSSAAEGDAFADNVSLMRFQDSLQQNNYRHRHQWEVEDLRKAGLNPILSANSAASVPSVGLPTMQQRKTPDFDIGKAALSITQSALAKKQIEIADKNAESERIKADADMLRARQDEARTPSAISLNTAQEKEALKKVEMADKYYDMDKIYKEAQISELQARIINATMQAKAYVEYMSIKGQADLITANAHSASAAAANRQAAASERMAEIADQNGISERALKEVLAGKADAETKEAMERVEKIAQERGIQAAHNPMATNPDDAGFARDFLMGLGETVRNGIGGIF